MRSVSGSIAPDTAHHDVRKFTIFNKLAAEFIGDAIFVFIGKFLGACLSINRYIRISVGVEVRR